jgi:hypothetical protein
MYISLHVTYQLFVRCKFSLKFLDRFSKNTQILHFMKILSVGIDLFHAKGRTERHDEANRRFSQFCESAKNPSYAVIRVLLKFCTVHLSKLVPTVQIT